METSAVETINVDEAFNVLTQNVFENLEAQGLLPLRYSTSGTFNSTLSGTKGTERGRSGDNINKLDSKNNQNPSQSGCCS